MSARAEGISIGTPAAAAGLSPSRVHQIVAVADLDALDAALGGLQAGQHRKIPTLGRTPKSAAGSYRRPAIGEVGWPRKCADWLTHLDADSYPPTVNLRPAEQDLEFRAFCTRRRLRFLNCAPGAGLWRVAGRAIPARRGRAAARLHR